jgi:O-acetylserine/cysteine efflux transporter
MYLKDIFWGVLVTFVWGLNFSVIKLGLEEIDPLVLVCGGW